MSIGAEHLQNITNSNLQLITSPQDFGGGEERGKKSCTHQFQDNTRKGGQDLSLV